MSSEASFLGKGKGAPCEKGLTLPSEQNVSSKHCRKRWERADHPGRKEGNACATSQGVRLRWRWSPRGYGQPRESGGLEKTHGGEAGKTERAQSPLIRLLLTSGSVSALFSQGSYFLISKLALVSPQTAVKH